MYMMNDREFSNRKETLHGEFYENALKYPERIALIYENEKVSYKMLRLYALRAANYMWQRGVRRNDKIVVILPRGIGQSFAWTVDGSCRRGIENLSGICFGANCHRRIFFGRRLFRRYNINKRKICLCGRRKEQDLSHWR